MTTSNDKIVKLWIWGVSLAPCFWLLGVNLWVYHFIAWVLFAWMFVNCSCSDRGVYIPRVALYVFIIFMTCLFSIVIHMEEHDLNRIIASFYNTSFWLMGLFLIVTFSNVLTDAHIPMILRAVVRIGWIVGSIILVGLFFILTGVKSLVIPTPFSFLSEKLVDNVLIRQSVNVFLIIFDWFASSERARFNAIAPYPTATAATIMMIFMMTLATWCKDRHKRLLLGVLLAVLLIGMSITLARTAILALIISLFGVSLIRSKYFLISMITIVCFFIWASPWIFQLLNFLWGLREGSGVTRLDLYSYSLQQLSGLNWITGLGIKPREEALEFPIGSHSTFVSLTYKTGLVGALAYVIFQASIFFRWYNLKHYFKKDTEVFYFWRALGWIIVGMGLWTLTEDLDAPQIVAFLYFSFVGMFEGLRKRVLSVSTSIR